MFELNMPYGCNIYYSTFEIDFFNRQRNQVGTFSKYPHPIPDHTVYFYSESTHPLSSHKHFQRYTKFLKIFIGWDIYGPYPSLDARYYHSVVDIYNKHI